MKPDAFSLLGTMGRLRFAVQFACLIFGGLLAAYGGWLPLEETFRGGRDIVRERPASGQIVIAEIDTNSLRQFSNWPWPRRRHAALLDQLQKAGVDTVAFDVDFSSPSNRADDAIFAAALARFNGTVVLPTFIQPDSAKPGNFVENLPIAAFHDNAFLGSVNVLPDKDGVMRNYSYGVVTSGIPRPSLGALIAGKPGQVGEEFRIDTAIAPDTIPRVSFADVVNGKVPASQLKGKTIIVGATAIEIGDRYAAPRFGVIPGVVIQAMGAETLLQNSTNQSFGPWPLIICAVPLGLLVVRSRRQYMRAALLLSGGLSVLTVPLALESARLGTVDIAPTICAGFAFSVGLLLISFMERLNRSRLLDSMSGLMNERALQQALATSGDDGVMVMHLRNFGQTVSVLNEGERNLLNRRILERISLTNASSPIFALQPGEFGWQTEPGTLEQQIEQAEALAALFVSPVALGSRSILVTPAFGMAERHSLSRAKVISAASLTAHGAADHGQRWAIHSAKAATATARAVRLLADLDQALKDGQIWVAFQPKWSIGMAEVIGAEALVRWRHPAFGPVSPDEFIPLLEQEGRLAQLTLKVVEQCLESVPNWNGDSRRLGIAINVSAPLLDDDRFVNDLQSRIADSALPKGTITIEVTESAAVTVSDELVTALEALRATGARVSIDDYGTGQSTLTYLKSFPTDEIKIDKSFVSRMLENAGDQVLVRSTIAMAHDLGFKVVAEGVEDAECLEKLGEFGCDIAQGWHIGKPMAEADFLAFVEAQEARLAA